MKVLLIGADGQLGKSLNESKPNRLQLISLNKKEFNLLDERKCRKIIQEIKPKWIINCAAYTNVDLAEREYDLAYKINTSAPQFLTCYLNEIEGKLLHISTDYVFDGKKNKPYQTFDKTNPLNKYGLTKSKGEENLKEYNNNLILRTSWLYSPFGQNFLTTMIKLHFTKGIKNEKLNVVYDQVSAPTSTKSLSTLCWKIIREEMIIDQNTQIMHWHDAGIASWYDFAVAIGQIAKNKNILKYTAEVVPIKSKEYPTPAKRPHYSLLDIEKTEKTFDFISNHWREELENTIEELR
ncbi:dTDP-4-dehydrorhamnose reductase [Prochlorococcus marinus]|uniref:dTDP-4-dehydrorhamnose reductase n=1 Tax=Prochlorococcus marinus str. PAC1 TaxID=59924 RepID=A0A0A2C8M8_PROMR|nr:dTDP-4-dehydrorhamnose reductase [Prochlorococcus marinus]KGG21892.1 dTDP-4-dehydrorhamnose reductase [Prochlorococcus marinus str. PAC1]